MNLTVTFIYCDWQIDIGVSSSAVISEVLNVLEESGNLPVAASSITGAKTFFTAQVIKLDCSFEQAGINSAEKIELICKK